MRRFFTFEKEFGIFSATGNVRFTVLPAADYRVEFEGVPASLYAGETLGAAPNAARLRYFDLSGNPTDNGAGALRYAKSGAMSSTATVQTARLQTFVYEVLDGNGSPTGEWLPCRPAGVVFHYTVFAPPTTGSPCLSVPQFAGCPQAALAAPQGGGEEATAPPKTTTEFSSNGALEPTLWQEGANPFVGQTLVGYELPEESDVRLEVYDALGARVAELVAGRQNAGRRIMRYDAKTLPSGVYTVTLRAVTVRGTAALKTMRICVAR